MVETYSIEYNCPHCGAFVRHENLNFGTTELLGCTNEQCDGIELSTQLLDGAEEIT